MSRISQDIDELERMIRDGSEKDDVLAYIRFISGEVSTLEAQYATLEQEHAVSEAAQSAPSPEAPLEHSRGVYYASGDPIPFCPRCYESASRERRHLAGPVPLWANETAERWECHACQTAYGAGGPTENFLPRPLNPRRPKT